MLTEQWVRDHLAALIDAADTIVLHEDAELRLTVIVAAFAELFAAVNVAGTAAEIRDRLLAADVVWLDAAGNVVPEGTAGAQEAARGYGDYINAWHDAGLLG